MAAVPLEDEGGALLLPSGQQGSGRRGKVAKRRRVVSGSALLLHGGNHLRINAIGDEAQDGLLAGDARQQLGPTERLG